MYGDKRDYTQAIEWYRRAAEQGEAISQVNLGLMYSSGQGVPQDYAQAVVWYRAAAEQGNATAQNNLGTLYYNGQGVPKDYAQALVWYRKAADQGNAGAKSNLSNLNFGQPAVSHQTQAEQVVTAQVSDPSIPGAIVCRDYDSVRLMIRLYRNSMEENLRASIIGAERERMLHGAPSSTPNLKRFGCVLLPSGTPMKWDGQWMPAIVTVKLSNGKTLRGVTDPSMIRVSKE
jgi:TPR repeat protein